MFYCFQTLLTSTELYKFIGIEAINDDKFLNLVGALGAVANAFGRVTWGLILDRFGTRATYTVAFFIQVFKIFIMISQVLQAHFLKKSISFWA